MKSSPNKNITINTQRLESEPFILKSMKQNKDKYCVFYKLAFRDYYVNHWFLIFGSY